MLGLLRVLGASRRSSTRSPRTRPRSSARSPPFATVGQLSTRGISDSGELVAAKPAALAVYENETDEARNRGAALYTQRPQIEEWDSLRLCRQAQQRFQERYKQCPGCGAAIRRSAKYHNVPECHCSFAGVELWGRLLDDVQAPIEEWRFLHKANGAPFAFLIEREPSGVEIEVEFRSFNLAGRVNASGPRLTATSPRRSVSACSRPTPVRRPRPPSTSSSKS